ncbi:10153_t:CDS:2, partial [Acaulospora colombiana]
GDAFMQRMYKSLPRLSASSAARTTGSIEPFKEVVTLPANSSEAEARTVYEQWAAKARFEYCDLEVKNADGSTSSPPNYKFSYNSDARMLVNSDLPKRSLAIARELAVLTTNLPIAWDSSVFLRVDESRVDIIKALITGPEGTPYEGKVCLSLLGTWDGPGWISGKSTLLQVLISIQSMILCEEPCTWIKIMAGFPYSSSLDLNEPGWANQAGTPASQACKYCHLRSTVAHQVYRLRKCQENGRAYSSELHISNRILYTSFNWAKAISQQLDKWLKLDDGQPTNGANNGGSLGTPGNQGSAFQRDVTELKDLLQKM